MSKSIIAGFGLLSLIIALPVSAHVVVKPAQATAGSYQTFVVGVPTEKDVPTIGLRLLIPAGLDEVTPNVKPGWKVSVKEALGSNIVTEIDWTGGSIPVGERDEFSFSTQVPSATSSISWKAYQTYADGSIVSWDRDPAISMDDDGGIGPYSITQIIPAASGGVVAPVASTASVQHALDFSIIALALSVVAFVLVLRKRGNSN